MPPFWLKLMRDVFRVEDASDFSVAFISKINVLIDQKSFGNDLNQLIVYSDDTKLMPG